MYASCTRKFLKDTMMKKTIILTLASFLATFASAQVITGTTPESQGTPQYIHSFDFDRGLVNIDARINTNTDFIDFFMLDYKDVTIFFCDLDQMQSFYLILKARAEGNPLPKVKFNGTWDISMSNDKVVIGDAARNREKLKEKHLNSIIECIEIINLTLNSK
jgi:hypothetical protein